MQVTKLQVFKKRVNNLESMIYLVLIFTFFLFGFITYNIFTENWSLENPIGDLCLAVYMLFMLFLNFIVLYVKVIPNIYKYWVCGYNNSLLLNYKLRFEPETSTIRTSENYYVATVNSDNTLTFKNLESNTRTINQKAVKKWYKRNVLN
jgi:hypothetical protein